MATPRYDIVEASAGQGGFGRIDKATDTTLERFVAIKTLDPLFKAKPANKDIQRFRREAKVLAQLSHPNIPAIYDVEFNPDEDEFRIIFEWIEGQTLRHRLQEQGVLTLDETRTFFSQVCSALAHAHDKGLVHRDVKPSNIILSATGNSCYLVDFGIALNREDITRITESTGVGTSGYMSPEQERGEGELSPASDVFSLGIVLYESLAGVRPAVGSYKSLALHNESYPPGVDDLVRQSLQVEPDLRPQSASEFLNKLLGALRPHSSFTSTLADGSLHEIQLALNSMQPNDFAALPPGQRTLVSARLDDLASVDDERLRRAVAALVVECVRLCHTTNIPAYADVIQYAFNYGYQKKYGETWTGNTAVRSALNEVVKHCNATAHSTVADEAVKMADTEPDPSLKGWYYHDLRILLQNLLINPSCGEEVSTKVGGALKQVNAVSH